MSFLSNWRKFHFCFFCRLENFIFLKIGDFVFCSFFEMFFYRKLEVKIVVF